MWTIKHTREISSSTREECDRALAYLYNRDDLGFFQIKNVEKAVQEVAKHSTQLTRYNQLVVIGLGGSSLGGRALVDALAAPSERTKIKFLDNVDSHSLYQWLNEQKEVESIGWVICSKSGNTLEALTLYDFCSQFFKDYRETDIAENTIIVSEEKSSIVVDFGKNNDCPQLTIPVNIGGRFSAFTPVGLLPAVFLGLSTDGFLKGFQSALANKKLIQEMVYQIWQSHLEGENIFYSFQYCDRLNTFGLWLQQLWSESLGKAVKRSGEVAAKVSTFVPCRGASDQHSVLQQIVEGPEKKFVAFHRVGSSEAGTANLQSTRFSESLMQGRKIGELLAIQAESTEKAISESQAGTMVLKVSDLTEASLSELMMSWMLTVGVLGELLDINAFDQPGVESGKAITRRVLSQVD